LAQKEPLPSLCETVARKGFLVVRSLDVRVYDAGSRWTTTKQASGICGPVRRATWTAFDDARRLIAVSEMAVAIEFTTAFDGSTAASSFQNKGFYRTAYVEERGHARYAWRQKTVGFGRVRRIMRMEGVGSYRMGEPKWLLTGAICVHGYWG
jgi:hypothetical protein